MSANKYKPHLRILFEDDANRQIANGFMQNPSLDARAIESNPLSGGWEKVRDEFVAEHAPGMLKNKFLMVLLLIDFDENEDRLENVKSKIDKDYHNLQERVFVLGTYSEPEDLQRDIKLSPEKIGKALAQDCVDETYTTWGHQLLQHNKPELDRMIKNVKPFLFPKK